MICQALKDKDEDIMPIATGHEREELQAELEVNYSIIIVL
jgi:hypothetical protein